MAKNLLSGPILAPLAQIWAQKFFYEFYLHHILGTVSSYHYMQYQGKLMNQTFLGTILAHLAPSVTTYHGQLS